MSMTVLYESGTSDREKIRILEKELLKSNIKTSIIDKKITKNHCISAEEINLEVFSTIGPQYVKCIITKHKDSDFIIISLLPIEGKVFKIYMTEKSYSKFKNAINKFKILK